MTDPRTIAIRNAILPRLAVGAVVPPAPAIGRALGISSVAAWKRLRRVLADAGVEVTGVNRGYGRRLVVERME